MQSKRAFLQVRHRLNICWAPWAAWKSMTACFSAPSWLCKLVEVSTLLDPSLQEVF